MLAKLRDLGLSHLVSHDMPLHAKTSGTISSRWVKDDVRVVCILLDGIGDTLVKERLAYQLPANAHHLVAQLRALTKSFRSLELPRELRDDIYYRALIKQPCTESEEFGYRPMTKPANRGGRLRGLYHQVA